MKGVLEDFLLLPLCPTSRRLYLNSLGSTFIFYFYSLAFTIMTGEDQKPGYSLPFAFVSSYGS